jgi:hypothetical protein
MKGRRSLMRKKKRGKVEEGRGRAAVLSPGFVWKSQEARGRKGQSIDVAI